MEYEVALGGKFEVATPDEVARITREHMKGLAAALRKRPMQLPLRGMGTAPASGVVTIDIGAPTPGFEWMVKRYSITGIDPVTPIVGTCVVWLGPENATLSQFDPLNFIEATTAIPDVSEWGDDEVVCPHDRHLLFSFSGIPAATQVFVSGSALVRSTTEEQTPVPIFSEGVKP